MTRKNSGETVIRIYLGNYELYRKYDSSGKLSIERSMVQCSVYGDSAMKCTKIGHVSGKKRRW